MIEIRPVWAQDKDPGLQAGTATSALLDLERTIVSATNALWAAARACMDEDEVDSVRFLHQSSHNDLISGCELARAGYLKQSYSLWRAWFEQAVFVLYFLEAPLHRNAWKVSGQVSLDDNPQYRLMLHQLLSESGERHPFALVYGDRYTKIVEALKINSNLIKKAARPISKATKVLTAFSQGVHGTFQPQSARSIDESDKRLATHCIPILTSAFEVIVQLWIILILSSIDSSPDLMLYLRDGDSDPVEIEKLGAPEGSAPQIAALTGWFKMAFNLS